MLMITSDLMTSIHHGWLRSRRIHRQAFSIDTVSPSPSGVIGCDPRDAFRSRRLSRALSSRDVPFERTRTLSPVRMPSARACPPGSSTSAPGAGTGAAARARRRRRRRAAGSERAGSRRSGGGAARGGAGASTWTRPPRRGGRLACVVDGAARPRAEPRARSRCARRAKNSSSSQPAGGATALRRRCGRPSRFTIVPSRSR